MAFLIWTRTFAERYGIEISGSGHSASVIFALRCSSYCLGMVAFALECLGPEYGEKSTVRESPILNANIYSIWWFGWMTPLMKRGVKQYITESDLPPLPPKDESVQLGKDLESAMSKQ